MKSKRKVHRQNPVETAQKHKKKHRETSGGEAAGEPEDLVWIQPEEILAAAGPTEEKETKEQNKKGHRARALAEVLYNCPYLLALLGTFAVAMVCSDQIGFRAVAAETRTMVSAMGSGVPGRASSLETAVENAVDGERILSPEESDGAQTVENEGIESAENVENNGENVSENMENEGERKEENGNIETKNEPDKEDGETEDGENTGERKAGVTNYEFYTPQQIDSPYYSDAGKIAMTTDYPYTKENDSYFNDAVFLGDSRTLGISDYAGLDGADFYCDSGMMIFQLLEPEGVTYQKTGKKEDVSLVLQQKQYGKIYLMLGMNELGYGNTQMYLDKYREVVEQIRAWQPDAIIYIMANLHVSKAKNNMETEFNNININDKNAASASLANGTDIFYLDANPLFTDEEGFLKEELTFDGVHLYAQHYDVWREFLLEHAVEPATQP